MTILLFKLQIILIKNKNNKIIKIKKNKNNKTAALILQNFKKKRK